MIVYILADALRPDHLSCYNGKVKTPNIDSLAKEGVLCENMFANSNATEPCITTILTGHYPHEHGIMVHPRYSTYSETAEQRINPAIEDHHLCNILRKEGYTSVLVDLLSIFNKAYFDEFIQVKSDLRLETKGEDMLAAALKRIEAVKSESKVFMFIHFWDTHHPYFPSYAGEVEKLDAEIGELVTCLDLDRDTVIFSADHGESIGEHVTQARATDPGHHHLYDEIIRIPFILRTPITNKVMPGLQASFQGLHEQIDILPTLLNWMPNIDFKYKWFTPNALDLGDELKDVVYLEEHTYQKQIGFRTQNFKFIEKIGELKCPLCNVIHGNGRYELYDLEKDPGEKENIAPLQELKTLNRFSEQAWSWYNARHLPDQE